MTFHPKQNKTKWSSLFGVRSTSKSSFPLVKIVTRLEKGSCAIAILDELLDDIIASMSCTLVSMFIGQRPNIDIVKSFMQKKWNLKGQVTVTVMAKGFLYFVFSCSEELSNILCEGPWVIGCSTLVLQKWSSNLDLNDSLFVKAPVWVRLPKLPLDFQNDYVFMGVENSFGELLSINMITTSRRRLMYAHIYT